MPGDEQKVLIYKGIYTVPAYVVNNVTGDFAEGVVDTKTITMEDGYSHTYNSGTLKYNGANCSMKISSEFTYSFVGSFYLSLMPQFSYFLGWDSKNDCAAFWYNAYPDTRNYTWNNETGIICANWLSDPPKRISMATGVGDPARWKASGQQGAVTVSADGFKSQEEAKSYVMDFGGDIFADVSDAIVIQEIESADVLSQIGVYTTNGVYLGTSVKGLAKGVYVVNGKKYVVK